MLFRGSAFDGPVGFDDELFGAINTGWSAPGLSPILDPLMIVVSLVGSYLLLLYVIPAWLSGRRERAFDVLVAIALALVLTTMLKYAIGRERPIDVLGAGARIVPVPLSAEDDPAFPSGHVSRAAAFAAVLSFHRRRLSAPLGLLVLAEAISRIYVGAHWPTDTIGGALLGLAIGAAVWRLDRVDRYVRLRAAVIRTLRLRADPGGRS